MTQVTTVATGASVPFALHPFSECLVRAGDYIYISHLTAGFNAAVTRLDSATLESDGTIDLGYLGLDDNHLYPTIMHDPTDDRLVVLVGGRRSGTTYIYPKLCKTAHTFGGTAEDWAANDFSDWVNLSVPQGSMSYAPTVMLDDGTLVGLFSERQGGTGFQEYSVWLYRYLGDGTSKTATQLASGSWSRLIHKPTWTGAHASNAFAYQGYPRYEGGRLHFTFGSHWDAALGARRWGKGYLYCENPTDATPVWRKADGTAVAVPLVLDDAAYADDVLFAYRGWSDYTGTSVMVDGKPRIACTTWAIDEAGDTVLGAGGSIFDWDGTQWVEKVLCPPDEPPAEPYPPNVSANGAAAMWPRAIVRGGDYFLASNRPISGQVSGQASRIVLDSQINGAWSEGATLGDSGDAGTDTCCQVIENGSGLAFSWVKGDGTLQLLTTAPSLTATPEADGIRLAMSGLTPPYLIERARADEVTP